MKCLKIIMSVAIVICCYSCEDKEAKQRIAQLEKEKAQLELQKTELQRQNDRNEAAIQEAKKREVEWKYYGKVEMYYMENGDIKKHFDDGKIYFLNSSNGERYKLIEGFGSLINEYSVALGTFSLSGDNGFMQFSAHAGKFYFDL